MAKRRPGRPQKSEDEKTSHRVTVGLTRDEFEKLGRWAEAFRISKSEVIRRTIHRAKLATPISVDAAKLLMEMGRMGQNLNQCARAAPCKRTTGTG